MMIGIKNSKYQDSIFVTLSKNTKHYTRRIISVYLQHGINFQ